MSICVATTTFYKGVDDFRFGLALKTIKALAKDEVAVVVVDGSNDLSIKEALRAAGVLVEDELEPGMGPGRRQALRAASRCIPIDGVVLWMEPEKYPLVPFVREICEPILSRQADIVVPRRKDDLASYPELQRLAELCGNGIYKAVTGLALDAWIGPRGMNRDGLSYFLSYDGKKYGDLWQVLFMSLLAAQKDGLRIGEVAVDYRHPPEQTEAEEKDSALGLTKRLEQLTVLGNALINQGKDLGLID